LSIEYVVVSFEMQQTEREKGFKIQGNTEFNLNLSCTEETRRMTVSDPDTSYGLVDSNLSLRLLCPLVGSAEIHYCSLKDLQVSSSAPVLSTDRIFLRTKCRKNIVCAHKTLSGLRVTVGRVTWRIYPRCVQ
jgi:hypothetical protein